MVFGEKLPSQSREFKQVAFLSQRFTTLLGREEQLIISISNPSQTQLKTTKEQNHEAHSEGSCIGECLSAAALAYLLLLRRLTLIPCHSLNPQATSKGSSTNIGGSDNIRRSTRVQKQTKPYDDGSSWDEESSEEEEEVVVPTRRSTRHISKRTSEYIELESASDDESYDASEEEVSEDDSEILKEYTFSRAIASKTLTLAEWKEVTEGMNTRAILNGSRWARNSDMKNPMKSEERFLVKWQDLSHLHCSWERESDLVRFCPAAKQKLGWFHKKSVGGFLYDEDARMDGVSMVDALFQSVAFVCDTTNPNTISHLSLFHFRNTLTRLGPRWKGS